jgi:predicted RNA-binding protein YlqC (UPF0109 family)
MNTNDPASKFHATLRWFALHPDHVFLVHKQDGYSVSIQIRCHPQDAPRFVGREGCCIERLQTIAKAIWAPESKEAWIARGGIQDNGADNPPPVTAWDKDWRSEFERGVRELVSNVFREGCRFEWSKDDRGVDVAGVEIPSIGGGTSLRRHRSYGEAIRGVSELAALGHGVEVVVKIRAWQDSNSQAPTRSPSGSNR